MSLPERPESRIEEYLSVLAEQPGAELPDHPESRIEEYLDVIARKEGSIPIATETTLGGVIVGNGLAITSDGILSLDMESADTEEY